VRVQHKTKTGEIVKREVSDVFSKNVFVLEFVSRTSVRDVLDKKTFARTFNEIDDDNNGVLTWRELRDHVCKEDTAGDGGCSTCNQEDNQQEDEDIAERGDLMAGGPGAAAAATATSDAYRPSALETVLPRILLLESRYLIQGVDVSGPGGGGGGGAGAGAGTSSAHGAHAQVRARAGALLKHACRMQAQLHGAQHESMCPFYSAVADMYVRTYQNEMAAANRRAQVCI
jgi:hypothetical protein